MLVWPKSWPGCIFSFLTRLVGTLHYWPNETGNLIDICSKEWGHMSMTAVGKMQTADRQGVRVRVRVSVRVKIKVRVSSSILPYCRSAGPVHRSAVHI